MKPKVLLLQGVISHYRVPIYNLINKVVDLTVAYSIKNECQDGNDFHIIKLTAKKIGIFYFNKGLFKLCNKFDVIIYLADFHFINNMLLPFIPRKFKVISWGIGVRASYKRLFDLSKPKGLWERLIKIVYKKSDANIFYMEKTFEYWSNEGLNEDSFFYAHNTVEVKNITFTNNKDSFLFIGTLYKEKGIFELLDSYHELFKRESKGDIPILNIIGKGEEYDNIKAYIEEYGMARKVVLLGAIYDENILAEYFTKAILCISPKQAGLGVLKSMGYGVPFVTREDAITGGERLNIINGYNGFLYNKPSELTNILSCSVKNLHQIEVMSNNAHNYYNEQASPQKMANGVLDAISYVLSH